MLAALLLATVTAAATPATESLDTPRFHLVYTERSAGAAKVLAEEIEARRDEIGALLGRDWDGKTEIRIGYGREEYEALALPGGAPPSWAVALAYPDANVMLLEAHSLANNDGQVTLRHELVHIALGRLGERWPRWFHEGMAQRLIGERQYSIDVYSTLARAVASDRIFKFGDLTDGFPERASDVEIAYAQSASFVGFLLERHSKAQFGELVDGVKAGEPFDESFSRAFRTTVNLEEREFRLDLPRRYPLWPVIATGTTLWIGLSLIVFLGFLRRRRVVALKRAEQLAEEAAEDAAQRILEAEEARLRAEAAQLPTLHTDDEPSLPPEDEKPTLH